jgi:sulfur relay (sulfurtransferase) DsrC/TusE family protein
MKIFLPSKKSFLFIPVFLLGHQVIEAQNVVVPSAEKVKTSPFAFNTANAKEGKAIYEMSCLSCHGTPGQGNFLKGLTPPPADLGTAVVQNKSDGEIFYNISEGNAIMPKFKTTLPENDRWKLVSYIRSFNNKYIQPAITKSVNLLTKTVQIDFRYDSIAHQISLMAYSVINKDTTRLKGSDELLFVKRYFGSLQIGKSVKINDKGIAAFDFPKTLPGDKNGTVELEARINDDKYGEIILSKKLRIGVPTYRPPLNEQRAIWNIQSKAPIWLLFTYFSIVVGVWLTIGYIVFNIYRIKQLSKNTNN